MSRVLKNLPLGMYLKKFSICVGSNATCEWMKGPNALINYTVLKMYTYTSERGLKLPASGLLIYVLKSEARRKNNTCN